MKNRKYKGYWIFIAAIVICMLFINRIENDRHSTLFMEDDFREEYIAEYTKDNADHLEYIEYENDAVKVYLIGPLSYNEAEYSLEVQYFTDDESSVLKIYSTDYTSLDNSGGKVLFTKNLTSSDSMVKDSFSLDQKVDSLFITIETQDTDFQIGRFYIQSESLVYNDTYFYCFITILSSIIGFFIINKKETDNNTIVFLERQVSKKRIKLSILFIMISAVFIASIPMINEKLFAGHDIVFHIARIEGIARGLTSGQFPVRIHGGTVNDYGYPNSLFYPELLMYIPAILSLFKISVVTAYKVYLIFINILTIGISYYSFKKLFNSRYIALAVSIIYLLNPYRLMVLYQRSAIGEFTAITFLPLILYGLFAIIKGNKKEWLHLTIGATGVLQSHFITTELVVIMCIVVFIVSFKDLFSSERRILYLIYAATATVLINLWFIAPMLLMMMQLGLAVFERSQSPFGMSRYDITNLFANSYFNFTGANPIGWVGIFSIGFYILYRLLFKKDEKHLKLIKLGDFLCISSIITAIATTAYFPWDILSKIPLIGMMLDAVQFPYRVLTLNAITISALIGVSIIIYFNKKESKLIVSTIAVLLTIISTFLYYEASFIENGMSYFENKHYYFNSFDNSLSVGQAEYLVEGANMDNIVAHKPIIESENETLIISDFKRYGTEMQFNYSIDILIDSENIIEIPFMYIPNYEILVNNEEVSAIKMADAKVGFVAPFESGEVSVRYSSPTTFRVFEIVSAVSVLALIFNKKILEFKNSIIKH